jgi:drug/metabolite transporter (DMT)-like permease
MQKNRQSITYITALATVMLWASSFPATKYALDFYSPVSLMLFRFILASLTLIIVGFIKKIKLPEKRDLPLFALGGFVGIFLYMVFFNTGATYVDSGVSSFIIASTPVFAVIFARIFLREKVSPLCWVGIIISLGGIFIIMLSHAIDYVFNVGIVLLLFAAMSGSWHNVIQRKILKKYTALQATTYTILAATIYMFMFFPALLRELPYSTVTVNLVMVYLGVFPAALAYLLWGFALSTAKKTSNVVIFLYLVPFFSIILGYFWLGEVLSIWSILGGVIIIAGMFLASTKRAQVE